MDRITQVLLALGTAVVVWFGVTQVRAGAISPGDLLVFTAYLSSLYKPIRKMASMTARVAKATASGERLLEIFDLHPDVAERPAATPLNQPVHGWVFFDEVSFSYAGATDPVLDHVSLELYPGEVTALVGPSGAGKSTLARLMMRFYDPAEGAVRIDGQDIRDITLDSLRSNIAVVLQDSVLFGTSIRDNIAYGRLDATDDDIIAAAKAAEADTFIQRMPDGYDTVLGERGETLSGGQRQRIAIARAILRDAPILILDEPLTGLDPATARDLLDSLRRAAAGRTTLLVAHDDLTLSLADHVYRVDKGKLTDVTSALRSRSA
jgi:ABC-type multidrug transport system fused ATPase/permease subunit